MTQIPPLAAEIDRLRKSNAELLAALHGAMFFVPAGTNARVAGDKACDNAHAIEDTERMDSGFGEALALTREAVK